MIWNSIISVIIAVFNFLIGLFPIADPLVTTRLTATITPFKTFMSGADWLFPVTDFFTILTIIMTVEAGILLIKILHWIVKNISAGFVK